MKNIAVEEVMTTSVVTISPETSLQEAVNVLDNNTFTGLPVVNDMGEVVGILTERDILKYTRWIIGQPIRDPARLLQEENDASVVSSQRGADVIELVASTTVESLMTKEVITVERQESILRVIQLMNEHIINRIPVLDRVGQLVGVVTRADVLRKLETWLEGSNV